jgi:hypothetical protein
VIAGVRAEEQRTDDLAASDRAAVDRDEIPRVRPAHHVVEGDDGHVAARRRGETSGS